MVDSNSELEIDKLRPILVDELPLFEEFSLDLVTNNYSEKTLFNYQRDLAILALYLRNNNLKFEALNKLAMNKFKDYLRTGKYLSDLKAILLERNPQNADTAKQYEKSSSKAPRRSTMYSGRLGSRSVNRMMSAIRTYLRFLLDADQNIPLAPDAVKLIKTERKESQVAELDELIQLIEAPDQFEKDQLVQLRNRAMLELLFATGMRISELISLNRIDIKINKETNEVIEPKVYVMGKGKKQRFVYFTPRAKHHLEAYLKTRGDDYPALFIPYRGLRIGTEDPRAVRVSVNYLQAKIKEYRTRIGIAIPTSAHSLRHGFATYLAENGANPAAIQKLLGHESLQTTSRYVHASDKFAEKSHKEFHPLKNE